MTLIRENEQLACETAENLKAQNPGEIAKRSVAVMNELKQVRQELENVESKLAASRVNDVLNSAAEIDGIKIVTARFDNTPAEELRKMCDTVKSDNSGSVAVFAAVNGEKLTFCASCGRDAVSKGAHAGNIVREVAKLAGGNGGGKPDSAMAGGKEISKTAEALNAVKDIVLAQLK